MSKPSILDDVALRDRSLALLTVRHHAAIEAMNGLLSNKDVGSLGGDGQFVQRVAEFAVAQADALLAELAK